ncbi:MAG: Lin0512 family protein [Granulosicoccus sp.]
MSLKRIIVEMGTGNDLYGEDYTKAAVRAVQDALHHSSLTLFKSLDIDPNSMIIEVIIGIEKPEQVDTDIVAGQIPYGSVTVNARHGGLFLPDVENQITTVVATAAVVASIDLPDERFALHE